MLKKIFRITLKCCLCNNYCFIFQGLSDKEEFVVSKALNAMTCLAEVGTRSPSETSIAGACV